MTPDPVLATYRDLLAEVDAWFADARRRHPGVVPCTAGCHACCHGPFDISIADVALLQEALRRLPPETQTAVRNRAARLAEQLQSGAPDWAPPYDVADLGEDRFDALVDGLADEPCPLLDESGNCLVYRDRPLVCRLMGLGLASPGGRIVENGCPIQDRFPGYRNLAPQRFDLERWEEGEAACLEAAATALFGLPEASGFETTIALALDAAS
jgi:Fe-S-cluster containining protein